MKQKYNKILEFIFIILFANCITYSQQHSFKVLAFYGEVYSQPQTTQSWTQVQTGKSLKNNFKIKLGKNSYLAMMYRDGRTMEMMSEGIFNVSELERNILNSKVSVTQKFTNFVAEQILVDKSSGKSMNELAAVVRIKPFHIESAIPTITSVLEPITNLSWYSYPSTKNYVLSILNSENTMIFIDLVEDTVYSLDTEKLKLNGQRIYKWYIVDADNPKITSDTNSITVLSEENRKAILDTIQIIEAESEFARSPLNILSLEAFFERNNLNLEALKQFRKAILLAPESEQYKKLFVNFLLKQKLYVCASELFK